MLLGGPSVVISWYRAAPTAKYFPTWNLFGSGAWDSEFYAAQGIGEQWGAFPKWQRGDTPPSAKGQHFAGPLAWFQHGQPYNPDADYERDAWGLLVACTGLRTYGGGELDGGGLVGSEPMHGGELDGGGLVGSEPMHGGELDGGGVAESGEAVFDTPGPDTWTCPDGVFSATVECWGAGAATGDHDLYGVEFGGGGGAYARSVVAVEPGTVYDLSVGESLVGNFDNGNSEFGVEDSFVFAPGGGDRNPPGEYQAPGFAADCVGDVAFDGAWGADAPLGQGGGGGSSAGSAAAGDPASASPANQSGGVAPTEGGDGGDGATLLVDAQAGVQPGGGGGGSTLLRNPGAAGGAGRVRISW